MDSELPVLSGPNYGGDPGANPENIALAALAKALGHPHRIAILRFLKACDACVCGGIVDHLPIAQSTVSQHLKKLKEAGWILGEVEGPRTCYCINPHALRTFRDLLDRL
jgi:ArsR family transcriptional regulator